MNQTTSQPGRGGYRYDYGLFTRIGVELEYMIVDAETLDVRPICDRVMEAVAGEPLGDATPDLPAADDGTVISWCNELALHLLEIRPAEPARSLEALARAVPAHITLANELLLPMGAMLLPGAMHPWMDPNTEMRLWPHEYGPVYKALDRIFGCRGHGWANLQSTHINLPFADDDEFARLHAAIRLVLPIVAGLAASSPVADGVLSGLADTRLEVYRTNSRALPLVVGKVIPERVFSRHLYENELLAGLYRAVAPMDPEGILQREWLNARGAIARFDRGAIEIRLIDVQECPDADFAIVALVVETVRALVKEKWAWLDAQQAAEVEPLHDILLASIRDGERALIDDRGYLSLFGVREPSMRIGDLWQRLASELLPTDSVWRPALETIFRRGTLSTRLRRALGPAPSRQDLLREYRELSRCLAENRAYAPS